MKAAGLLFFFFVTTVSAQSSLPECRGTDVSRWTNCQGTATYPIGKYIGEFRDGKPHGRGTGIFADGDKYVGEHRNGLRSGQGTYTYVNGNQYVGEYRDDKRHGHGTYTFANGNTYVGEHRDSKIHGRGTYSFANGEKYVGEFKDEKYHGLGAYTFADGKKYVGKFKDGKYDGQGIFFFVDGRPPLEGVWAADKLVRAERIPDNIAGRTSTPPLGSAPVYGDATQPSVQSSSRSKEYLARHILVEREADAEAIISRLTVGEKFDNFIHLSKDPGTSRQGGTLGWADAKTFVEPFASAMIALGKGQFTRTPVFTVFGWHVILLDDIRERESPVAKASRPVEAPRSITPLSLFASASQPDTNGVVTLTITTGTDTGSLRINGDEEGGNSTGRYLVRRFVPIGETRFEIQATDRFGNVQRQTVSITRTFTETAVRLPSLNPSRLGAVKPRDAVAIIIGIEKYRRAPKAEFASRDANLFVDYAQRALGVKPENIRLLSDDKAESSEILLTLRSWLPTRVNRDKTDVFVFYSGHGLSSPDGESLFLLPYDVNRDLLDRTAITRKEVIELIAKSNPRSATLFMDACYSGQTRTGETLLASARPISISAKQGVVPKNFTVFSASAPDQISSSSPEVRHGIFSYFLMRGLEGDADQNKDGQISVAEMQAYLAEQVPRQALSQNRVQRPQVIGDQGRVLVGR